MRKIKYNKIAGMAVLYMLALLFIFALLPGRRVCAQDIRKNIELPVAQKFILKNVQNDSVNQKAAYELIGENPSTPMPEGSVDGKYAFSLEGDEQTALSMSYVHGGVYQYQIFQITSDAEGYDYDRKHYSISVYICNGENAELIPQVIVHNEKKEKCEEILFQNTYTGTKTPSVLEEMNHSKPIGKMKRVKTGESAAVSVWMTMLMLSFLGMLSIGILKRK